MPLTGFPRAEITIVGADGTEKGKVRATLTSDLAVVDDTRLQIEINDEVRRRLPNGAEEAFIVLEPTFYDAFHGIRAHYQLKLRRKGANEQRITASHVTVSGANARVNISSQDYSTNTSINSDEFGRLRAALIDAVQDPSQSMDLVNLTHALEQEAGKPGFGATYQKFIGAAGDHMKIIGPFLPMLAQLFHH